MPIINADSYRPSFLLRNGHINTIYPYYFRKKHIHHYSRKRLQTPDGDFFDIDFLFGGHPKIAILLHGLEGSSDSQYINGLTKVLFSHGYDIAAVNFRSCSGELNLLPEMYHSGYTKDLPVILSNIEYEYEDIVIAGFSLGGNVTMKFAGEQGGNIHSKIKAVVGVSVPCDLRAGSLQLKKWYNYPYEQMFLKTLLIKAKQKSILHPDLVPSTYLEKVKTLWDFDEYYTACLHQFSGAEDYYAQCNSKQFLHQIKIPALMINAKDDSFLPQESYPYEAAASNPFFNLMVPEFGGHVGFATPGQKTYWTEDKILTFFDAYTQSTNPKVGNH